MGRLGVLCLGSCVAGPDAHGRQQCVLCRRLARSGLLPSFSSACADDLLPVLPSIPLQFVIIPAKANASAEAQGIDYEFNIPEDHLPGLHWVGGWVGVIWCTLVGGLSGWIADWVGRWRAGGRAGLAATLGRRGGHGRTLSPLTDQTNLEVPGGADQLATLQCQARGPGCSHRLPLTSQAHPHKHGSTMLQTVTASFMIIVEDDHDKWLPKDNGCTEVRDALRCVRQLGCWLVGCLRAFAA